MLERLGPRSIAGNINTPVKFGRGWPRSRREAATRNAPSQEMKKVNAK
jgi:hypothetical protein